MSAETRVVSVTELNRLARLALERGLTQLWVSGEISNLVRAASGHWYFTLKDAQAAVRCAMFRNRNQFLDWRPENGMQVEVRAQPTLYEARGEFQLTVEALRRAGLGALFEAFQRLKERLEREGLFDPDRKRPLPPFPRNIGIVTSPRAAALRDVLTTLARRWPVAGVVLYPTLVQGEGAAARIAAALRLAGERRECEVLLLVRGGGSIEDLWAFNEEVVARTVAASPVPVVSGVGHETDFSIADFAADLRAPTPTAAAQLATPERTELARRVDLLWRRLGMDEERRLHAWAQRLDGLARRLRHPAARLEEQGRHLRHLAERLRLVQDGQRRGRVQQLERLRTELRLRRPDIAGNRSKVTQLGERLARALHSRLERRGDRLTGLAASLLHLNPEAVLQRGYCLVRDEGGHIVRDSDELVVGQGIGITLARGEVGAQVTQVNPATGSKPS